MVLVRRYHNRSRTYLQQPRLVGAYALQHDRADGSQVPIKWESVDVTPQIKNGKTVIPDKAIDSVKKNFVALKGPLAVRLGKSAAR